LLCFADIAYRSAVATGALLRAKAKALKLCVEILTNLVTVEAKVSGSGQNLLGLGDGLSVESDTGLGIKNGAFPEHDLEATHTTEEVLKLDFAKLGLSVLGLELLELLLLAGDDLGDGILEGLGGGVSNSANAGSSGELAGRGSGPESNAGKSERQHL